MSVSKVKTTEEIEERIIVAIDWKRLAAIVKDKLSQIEYSVSELIEYEIQGDMKRNVVGEVTKEAREMACSLIDKVLLGDEAAFRDLFGINDYGFKVCRYTSDLKLTSAVALRREVLEQHKLLFQNAVIDDLQREIVELREHLVKRSTTNSSSIGQRISVFQANYRREHGDYPSQETIDLALREGKA